LDGIDGYAGSESIFLALAGYILFGGEHFLVLIFATLGFLVWNWHKAKIFMGDVGSTLLGYNIAIFTLYYSNQNSENFWIWIVLFGLFWFDATLTLFRRKLNGEQLSIAHKKHAYQRLTQAGFKHDKVVFSSIVVNLCLFLFVYFFTNPFLSFFFSITLLSLIMWFVEKKKTFKD
jgi:Fuc2NAc and GlcNAc transferase